MLKIRRKKIRTKMIKMTMRMKMNNNRRSLKELRSKNLKIRKSRKRHPIKTIMSKTKKMMNE